MIYTHNHRQFYDYNEKGVIAIKESDEKRCCIRVFRFTTNPLLSDRFMYPLSESDKNGILGAADSLSIWKLSVFHNIDFQISSIKPCYNGTLAVDLLKGCILKKLIKRYSKHSTKTAKCIVVDDSIIPSLPVYEVGLPAFKKMVGDWFGEPECDLDARSRYKSVNKLVEWSYVGKGEKINIVPAFGCIHTKILVGNKCKTTLVQVEAVLPIPEYKALFGEPKNELETPFCYNQKYWGTWESFYISCPSYFCD